MMLLILGLNYKKRMLISFLNALLKMFYDQLVVDVANWSYRNWWLLILGDPVENHWYGVLKIELSNCNGLKMFPYDIKQR